jgi:hypothetical protein
MHLWLLRPDNWGDNLRKKRAAMAQYLNHVSVGLQPHTKRFSHIIVIEGMKSLIIDMKSSIFAKDDGLLLSERKHQPDKPDLKSASLKTIA